MKFYNIAKSVKNTKNNINKNLRNNKDKVKNCIKYNIYAFGCVVAFHKKIDDYNLFAPWIKGALTKIENLSNINLTGGVL